MCNYHTRALRHVHTQLTDDLAQTAACSIVTSRLDYCNAMLYGALVVTFDVLLQAQNNFELSASEEVELTPDYFSCRSTGCQSSFE